MICQTAEGGESHGFKQRWVMVIIGFTGFVLALSNFLLFLSWEALFLMHFHEMFFEVLIVEIDEKLFLFPSHVF